MIGTAWTVFTGTQPEPMQVEILGVLRGGRGPGHDMILAQLHGTKPEYTGVVAGMSGSPVYIGDKLLGSLSFRIGQFSKDPIAGITPIEQMLEVRDLPPSHPSDKNNDVARVGHPDFASLPAGDSSSQVSASSGSLPAAGDTNMQAMETPLVMSGFRPEAVRLWQDRMKGTGLDMVAAGGMGGSSVSQATSQTGEAGAIASILPGSAVSAQLVRGDLEIAATCTVTYVDPKQLLACGHPILQAGSISVPMTATEVVATLASPLNAFKIVNTGAEIGAFTEDRDAAIKGIFGAKARMIPVAISIHGVPNAGGDGTQAMKPRKLNVEVLDLPMLTPQAILVSIYNALLESNESSSDTSYHVSGSMELDGANSNSESAPIDAWASGGDGQPASMMAALGTAQDFTRFYLSSGRQGSIRGVHLDVEVIPRRIAVELESARIVSSNIVHAGDTVTIEATVRPYQQPARNIRVPVTLPARLQPGAVRVLVSDAATLERTLDQPRMTAKSQSLDAALAQARAQHAADRVYVSLLEPETQAGVDGRALTGLPLSMANALETQRAGQEATLNGETAITVADSPVGGLLGGFQILTVQIEPGGGVH